MNKVKVSLRMHSFHSKPTNGMIARISGEIASGWKYYNRNTIPAFVRLVGTEGHTFCPATFHASFNDISRRTENFEQVKDGVIGDGKVIVEYPSEDWLFHDDKEKPICNFLIEVEAKVDVQTENCTESYIEIVLVFKDGAKSDVLLIPYSDLENVKKWSMDADNRCRFHLDYPINKANRYLFDTIRTALDSVSKREVPCISKLGINKIGDIVVFFAGDQLIWPSYIEDKPKHRVQPSLQRLAIDTERFSERDAVAGMIKLIKLAPKTGRIIHAHAISGVMRTVYIEAGAPPKTTLQVIEESGMLKTTYISFLTQLYNRNGLIEPQTRLNATLKSIEELLNDNNDSTVVLDDVHDAETRAIKRECEATLEKIIRQVGDGKGRGHMVGKKLVELTPRSNVIVSGEYAFGKGSTAARSLVVKMTENIDSVGLHECQENPLLVSTFYYYFIAWYVENYNAIRDFLKVQLSEFRKISYKGILKRLNATFFCLNTAFVLFMQYCFEKGFVSEEDAQHLHGDFRHLLTDLVFAQNDRYEQSKNNETSESDLLSIVSTSFKNGRFRIAKNAREYIQGKHDGLIHDGCLCLRKDSLVEKLRISVPSVTIQEIVQELDRKGALIKGNNEPTKQIFACNGKRFYFIPLNKL